MSEYVLVKTITNGDKLLAVSTGGGDDGKLLGVQSGSLAFFTPTDNDTVRIQDMTDFTGTLVDGHHLYWDNASSSFKLEAPASAGEVNTASNVGVGGVGLFDTKAGSELQFKNLNNGTGISITDDVGNNEVDISLNANISDLLNVNCTTPANNDILRWNGVDNWVCGTLNDDAVSDLGNVSDAGGGDNNDYLKYDTGTGKWRHTNLIAGTNMTINHTATSTTFDATGGGTDSISVSFGSHNNFERTTTNSSYDIFRKVIFLGSTAVGTPSSIKACIKVAGGTTSKARVYDDTNSQVIAELTGISNTAYQILDLGTISNVPTGEACWSIELAGTGSLTIHISSLIIKF